MLLFEPVTFFLKTDVLNGMCFVGVEIQLTFYDTRNNQSLNINLLIYFISILSHKRTFTNANSVFETVSRVVQVFNIQIATEVTRNFETMFLISLSHLSPSEIILSAGVATTVTQNIWRFEEF